MMNKGIFVIFNIHSIYILPTLPTLYLHKRSEMSTAFQKIGATFRKILSPFQKRGLSIFKRVMSISQRGLYHSRHPQYACQMYIICMLYVGFRQFYVGRMYVLGMLIILLLR